jgi:hypothetical protein
MRQEGQRIASRRMDLSSLSKRRGIISLSRESAHARFLEFLLHQKMVIGLAGFQQTKSGLETEMAEFVMLVFAAFVLIISTWIYMDYLDMKVKRENEEKRKSKSRHPANFYR